VKLSKADFAVRCGVNAGLVYFDDSPPLKTISDRVIDVAEHMQKNAEPNTVLAARKIIEPLRQLEQFTHTTQVIVGYEASATGFGDQRYRQTEPHDLSSRWPCGKALPTTFERLCDLCRKSAIA
jgi:hypothetical protein